MTQEWRVHFDEEQIAHDSELTALQVYDLVRVWTMPFMDERHGGIRDHSRKLGPP